MASERISDRDWLAMTPHERLARWWDRGDGPVEYTAGNTVFAQDVGALLSMKADLVDALGEAVTQIEYLHAKFKPTGSGEQVLARARAALSLATGDA